MGSRSFGWQARTFEVSSPIRILPGGPAACGAFGKIIVPCVPQTPPPPPGFALRRRRSFASTRMRGLFAAERANAFMAPIVRPRRRLPDKSGAGVRDRAREPGKADEVPQCAGFGSVRAGARGCLFNSSSNGPSASSSLPKPLQSPAFSLAIARS